MESENKLIQEREIGLEEQDKEKLSEFGFSKKDIESLKEGSTDGGTSAIVCFIGNDNKDLVIKKGLNVDGDLNAKREYAFLKLLKLRGGEKNAPDPYYYNPNNDILIMEKIDGESISKMSNEDIVDVAKALGKLHKPEFYKPGIPFHKREKATQYNRLIEQVNFLEEWFVQIAPFIEKEKKMDNKSFQTLNQAKDIVLEQARDSKQNFDESSFSLIHYDLNPENIFRDKEKNILFLDWRQAVIGDRAMDVAKLFYKNYLNKEQKELFFKSYEQKMDDLTIRQRAEVYEPLIRLGSILWRLRFLNIDIEKHPEIKKNVDINLVRERLKDDFEYLFSFVDNK
jgi:thiamine kinase-like enzyme